VEDDLLVGDVADNERRVRCVRGHSGKFFPTYYVANSVQLITEGCTHPSLVQTSDAVQNRDGTEASEPVSWILAADCLGQDRSQ